jgi:hypothetical protein
VLSTAEMNPGERLLASGPYRDTQANLYNISILEKDSNGGMGLLERDPSILEELNR